MRKEKVLIIEDNKDIREGVRILLESENYRVQEAENGRKGLEMLDQETDLVILDIMMPFMDGMTCLKEMRLRGMDVPVIILTARGEEYDKLEGLGAGADDYVVKPFSPKELMMRIHAIMNRVRPDQSQGREILRVDGLVIDFTGRMVEVDGERVDLSPKEYDLLFYMASNKNIALTREKLITNVWGYDFYGDDRTLDTHIKLLRKSLGPYSRLIVTLRGVGYRFEA